MRRRRGLTVVALILEPPSWRSARTRSRREEREHPMAATSRRAPPLDGRQWLLRGDRSTTTRRQTISH